MCKGESRVRIRGTVEEEALYVRMPTHVCRVNYRFIGVMKARTRQELSDSEHLQLLVYPGMAVALSQANWEAYTADEVQELPHGHLVPYPIEIGPDGVMNSLLGHRNFPDTQGHVLGKKMWAPAFLMKSVGLLTT